MMDRREHLVSLNISFHSMLHLDNRSRSDCSKRWSFEEDIDRRHLVSSAKRNVAECTIEEGKLFIQERAKYASLRLRVSTGELLLLIHTTRVGI